MNAVSVKRLRLKAPQEDRGRTIFCIEDALRTEIAATDRLILMRRLKLDGRASSSAAYIRSNCVRNAFALETANGCHASSAGAITANCVWFSDVSEARRMLLAMLIKGLEVRGWFWQLAIPEWQGEALSEWTGARLREIFATSRPGALMELVDEFVRLNALDKLAQIVAKLGTVSASDNGDPASIFASPSACAGRQAAATDRLDGISIEIQAAALLSRLPQAARLFLSSVRQAGMPTGSALEKLCEYMLLEAAPALSLNRPRRMLLVKEVVAKLDMMSASPQIGSSKSEQIAARKAGVSKIALDATLEREYGETKVPHPQARTDSSLSTNSTADQRELEQPKQQLKDFWKRDAPLSSKAAGLWLVIPTMIRCGWREWLQDHRDLLAEDPGRLMLRTIAQHHRVDPLDDTLLPLGEADEDIIEQDWARLWRRGIDGWLYHKTRVRLHNLIWRPGKLGVSEERVNIHFPLADADLRLRIFALDVDPGWTDWLGLSVRYHFGEKAEQ